MQVYNRIVVDCKEFNCNERKSAFDFDPEITSKIYHSSLGEHLLLTDEDLMICKGEMPGFSLVSKRWGFFDTSKIHDVNFDSMAFDGLVLSHEKKTMISALVDMEKNDGRMFGDLIAGKGTGVIFLLHGPPGVGKTFTAGKISWRG